MSENNGHALVMPTVAEEASLFFAKGFAIIAVHGVRPDGGCTCEDRTNCKSIGKHPIKKGWQNEAFPEAAYAETYFRRNPLHNIGAIWGKQSYKIDVEADGPEAEQVYAECFDSIITPTYQSGRGKHRIFATSPALDKLPQKAVIKAGKGDHPLEIRLGAGKGAQSVLPPSRYWRGGHYHWLPGLDILRDEIEAPPFPESAVKPILLALGFDKPRAMVNGHSVKPPMSEDEFTRLMLGSDEGSRNEDATRLCGYWFHHAENLDEPTLTDIWNNLVVVNSKSRPPLSESELRKPFNSILNAERHKRISTVAQVAKINNEHDDDPFRLGRKAQERWAHPEGVRLRRFNGEWFEYSGKEGRYIANTDEEIKSIVIAEIRAEFERVHERKVRNWNPDEEEKEPPKIQRVTTGVTNNTVAALASQTLLPGCVEPPAWLGADGVSVDTGPFPADRAVVAPNGIWHLPSIAEGKPHRVELTPRFWTTNAIDYRIEPEAPPAEKWFAFLDSIFPKDPQSKSLLQEWFGYCLTRETEQQKILLLIGPKRSGKGTIARVLRQLVGPVNCCGPTLGSLGGNFGLQPLLGKTLAVISDARLSKRTDVGVITERLLALSGEDAITVDRKHRESVNGQLPIRFVILTNELPKLSDSSGALASRFLILRFTESFYGREDHGLTRSLLTELPSIFLWALDGWMRLCERGHFCQPDAAKEIAEQLDDLASPVKAFVKDCCITEPAGEVAIASLYQEWREWCERVGRDAKGTEQTFGRDLRAAFPALQVHFTRIPYRHRVYTGIRLRNEIDNQKEREEEERGDHVTRNDTRAQPLHAMVPSSLFGSEREEYH